MTIAQQIGRVSANLETAARAGEFATLAKFILANGGFSNAAAALEVRGPKDNILPSKLADIIKTGIFREPLQQKTAVGAGTLAAFSDYSVIAQGFVNSLLTLRPSTRCLPV